MASRSEAEAMQPADEFRQHWRQLTSTFLGIGTGLGIYSYILSTFAPYLMNDFGWTRSQFALLGIASLFMTVAAPAAGRMTDLFGVRRVAAVGAVGFPLLLTATAMMNGNIYVFLAILAVQNIICATTTGGVYSRLIAEKFVRRRGLALGISGLSVPLVAALGSQLLSGLAAAYGWRAGYFATAAFCALGAGIALMLIPPAPKPRESVYDRPARRTLAVYRNLAAMPVFWLLIGAIFLANLPFALVLSQLKLVTIDQGVSDSTAALMVSAFAIASIVGRLLSGAALDYLPSPLVASISFGMPFVGLLVLALPHNSTFAVATAIVLIGLSFGGESGILPYLISRFFGLDVFSTVFTLMSAVIALALGVGNATLAWSLQAANSFVPYLVVAAAGSFVGSLLFLVLATSRFRQAAIG
jgi:MFS family permease